MIIAQELKKNNLAEYILYMWQVEDLIRACKFDQTTLENQLISRFDQPEEISIQIRNWYFEIAEMMKEEGIIKSGHLQFLVNQVNDLNDFHLYLLKSKKDSDYQQLYNTVAPVLTEYALVTKPYGKNETQICFDALYATLILRLRKSEISSKTAEGVTHFSKLISALCQRYQKFEKGKISYDDL